jgi:hypothetical protein
MTNDGDHTIKGEMLPGSFADGVTALHLIPTIRFPSGNPHGQSVASLPN